MADTVTPQGVVAVARQFPTAVKDVLVAGANLIVICEEVRDPGNLGTIIRAADAVGADGVVLTGRTVDVYNAKVVRSTTGSLFHIPVAIGGDLDDVLVKARAAGLQVLAADIKGGDLLDARREGARSADGVVVRQRGAWTRRRRTGRRRPRAAPADLRPCRVAQSRDGGERVPLRIGVQPARRRITTR